MSLSTFTTVIRQIALGLGITVFFLLPLTATAQENVLDDVCASNPEATLCKENSTQQTPTDNSIYGPNGIITKVVKLLSIALGVVAIIMIIIAGLKYILSSGDPTSVNSAKNTIIYAVIGLVVAIMAQALIIFVLNKL